MIEHRVNPLALVLRRQKHPGLQAQKSLGKFLALAGVAKHPLHHGHLGIEVVDHRDEDGLRRGGHRGGPPAQLALMAEDDVLQSLRQISPKFFFRFRRHFN